MLKLIFEYNGSDQTEIPYEIATLARVLEIAQKLAEIYEASLDEITMRFVED